jgi:hypothetical protein
MLPERPEWLFLAQLGPETGTRPYAGRLRGSTALDHPESQTATEILDGRPIVPGQNFGHSATWGTNEECSKSSVGLVSDDLPTSFFTESSYSSEVAVPFFVQVRRVDNDE